MSAVSLAGPGKFTEDYLVIVGDRHTSLVGILLPIFGCALLLMIIGSVAYFVYKKNQQSLDEETPNPLYMKVINYFLKLWNKLQYFFKNEKICNIQTCAPQFRLS